MESLLQILTQIYEALVLSGFLQKFNNLQHYQYEYNALSPDANTKIFDANTIHSLSISANKISSNFDTSAFYNLTIDGERITYCGNITMEASTLFNKEIILELLPNTKINIIKQY
jgi:hypothetical protein